MTESTCLIFSVQQSLVSSWLVSAPLFHNIELVIRLTVGLRTEVVISQLWFCGGSIQFGPYLFGTDVKCNDHAILALF